MGEEDGPPAGGRRRREIDERKRGLNIWDWHWGCPWHPAAWRRRKRERKRGREGERGRD
jgi:hypothetical protein